VSGGGGSIATATSSSSDGKTTGETSAVDIANAAAEYLQDTYGARSIPRGGLCVHKPHWGSNDMSHCDPGEIQNDGTAERWRLPLTTTSTAMDDHEEFLTFTRNVFLQTPRPHSKISIDEIWDDTTAEKYKVEAPPESERSDRGANKPRGNKRKAAAASLTNDVAVENDELLSSAPSTPKMSMQTGEIAVGIDVSEKTCSMDVGLSINEAEGKVPQDSSGASTKHLPLCGLEDDEQALSYLHTNSHSDPRIAKLSIMVNLDRGYGKLCFRAIVSIPLYYLSLSAIIFAHVLIFLQESNGGDN
jgi:hypothetical protein